MCYEFIACEVLPGLSHRGSPANGWSSIGETSRLGVETGAFSHV